MKKVSKPFSATDIDVMPVETTGYVFLDFPISMSIVVR